SPKERKESSRRLRWNSPATPVPRPLAPARKKISKPAPTAARSAWMSPACTPVADFRAGVSSQFSEGQRGDRGKLVNLAATHSRIAFDKHDTRFASHPSTESDSSS